MIFAATNILQDTSRVLGTRDLLSIRSERLARSAKMKLFESTLRALSKALELSDSASAQAVLDLAQLSLAAHLCSNWHNAHGYRLQTDMAAPCSSRSLHMPHMV